MSTDVSAYDLKPQSFGGDSVRASYIPKDKRIKPPWIKGRRPWIVVAHLVIGGNTCLTSQPTT
jgi:hypothetical protein